MNDQSIIEALRSSKRDKALIKLYRYYPKVEKLILSKGGNKQDAQDIFQEGLLVLCKRVKEQDFKLTSKAQTYLYSICRFLWKNELKKLNRKPKTEMVLELSSDEEESLEAILQKEEKIKIATQILSELGERCWRLLKLFYYQSLRMKEIAQKMGFSSEKIARNQKYKCLERAKRKLKEKIA